MNRQLKRLSSYLFSAYGLGVAVTLLVTYAAIDFYAHPTESTEVRSLRGFIRLLHEKTIDYRMIDRGPIKGSDQIVILAIDDDTLRLEGRWPWPREKTARLVDRTMMYGAKSLSFDMIFSEADNNSALPAVSRLEKVAKESKAPTSKLIDALNEEAARADVDKIFANTIGANQDSLVMGSFYLHETPVAKEAELCLDGYYDRLYASRYWSKEAIPLSVVDTPLEQLKYPRELRTHLSSYFLQLEVEAANVWFDKNKQSTDRIRASLTDYKFLQDAAYYPGLSVLVFNNDFESGLALIGDEDVPQNLDTVRRIYAKFASGLEPKETAELTGSVRKSSLDYCERFFTPLDELLKIEEYKRRWGDTEEKLEAFQAYSWDSFWKSLPNNTESAPLAINRIRNELIPNKIPMTLRWELNIPTLADATKHTGYFNAIQDLDGSVRRARLLTRFANNYAPSLVFKTYLVDTASKPEAKLDRAKNSEGKGQVRELSSLTAVKDNGKSLNIPVDSQGTMLINYSGPQHMFPHIRATDILSDTETMTVVEHVQKKDTGEWADVVKLVDKKKFLKDKIVFFGVTAVGVFDLRVTPFDGNFPGVETHANALSNLLTETSRLQGMKVNQVTPGFLKTSPYEENLMVALLMTMGTALAVLIVTLGSIAGLMITLATLGALYIVDKYYLFQEGILVASQFPVALVLLEFVSLTFYKYFTEEKTKRELKDTFEKYVSPSIVNEVLADPSNIELGGKKMELTVMFSDVRGFTTMSENLDPRALSDLLNSYLTPMTNLVFANKGTLDKYMGDAIMAFWGAPVHFPDHAAHACRCALQMLVKLKELQADYKAKGLPSIDIGIGLNTGEMSVGNMGSDTVRSYTVMGDAVNLGSRLEGINKNYGTRIIISEFTYRAVEKKFTCREVDWVTVKGKLKPVRIYELIAEGKVSDQQAVLIRNFNEGFQLYHQQRFGDALAFFRRALQVNPDDAPSQLYLERCEDYVQNPPAADWNGVFEMKTK